MVNRDVQVFLIIWTRTLVFICASEVFSFQSHATELIHTQKKKKKMRVDSYQQLFCCCCCCCLESEDAERREKATISCPFILR